MEKMNIRKVRGPKKTKKKRKISSSSSNIPFSAAKRRPRIKELKEERSKVKKGKVKKKKKTPFEKFSNNKSKDILKLYKEKKEVQKGRRKTKSEIEKEKQIALNQYYENGLIKYREKRFLESYEILKRGYSSLQHAITHVFELTEEEMKNQIANSSRSSRRKKSTMKFIKASTPKKKSAREEEEEVNIQNLFTFIKKLSKDISYILCKVCFILKYYEECIYYAEKTLLLDPISTKCYHYSSFAAYYIKDYSKAADAFEKLLLVIPPPHDDNDISLYIDTVEHGISSALEENDEHMMKRKRKKEKTNVLFVNTVESLTDCMVKLGRHESTVKYSSVLIDHYDNVLRDLRERKEKLIQIANLRKQQPRITEMYDISQATDLTNKKMAGLYCTRACSNEILGGRVSPIDGIGQDEMEGEEEVEEINEESIRLAKEDYSKILIYDPEFLVPIMSEAEEYRSQNDIKNSLKSYLEILKIERDKNHVFETSIIVSDLYQNLELEPNEQHTPTSLQKVSQTYQYSIHHLSNALDLRNEVSTFFTSSSSSNDEQEEEQQKRENEIMMNHKICELYLKRGNYYRELNEHSKSILDFTTARELNPKNCFVYKSRGFLFLSMNRIHEAKHDFEEFSRIMRRKYERNEIITNSDSDDQIYQFLFEFYLNDDSLRDEEKYEKCVSVICQLYKCGGFCKKKEKSIATKWVSDHYNILMICFVKVFMNRSEQKRLEREITQEKERELQEQQEQQQEKSKSSTSSTPTASRKSSSRSLKSNLKKKEDMSSRRSSVDMLSSSSSVAKLSHIPSLYLLCLQKFHEKYDRMNGPFEEDLHVFRKLMKSVLMTWQYERGIDEDYEKGLIQYLNKTMPIGKGRKSRNVSSRNVKGKRKKKR